VVAKLVMTTVNYSYLSSPNKNRSDRQPQISCRNRPSIRSSWLLKLTSTLTAILSGQFHIDLIAMCWIRPSSAVQRGSKAEEDVTYLQEQSNNILRNRSIIQYGVSQILIHSQQFTLMGNVEADVNAITILFVCVIYGDCKHENKHSVSIEKEEFLH
jgi:hypothetical protein